MLNPLSPYAKPTFTADAYHKIQHQLGQDDIVFLAMNQVSQRRGLPFDLPSSPTEYAQKHREIEQALTRYQALLNRQGLFFDLMEEIQSQLMAGGQRVLAERLRDLAVLPIDKRSSIKLSADGAWLVEWRVSIDANGYQDDRNVFAATYDRVWGAIVPWHVVQYLDSGILLYTQKAYSTALVLMSIAVEATLRDVLSTRKYAFASGTSKVDVYGYSRAQVDVDRASYRLTFLDDMPKSPADLASSAGGVLPVDIKIRRAIHPRTENVHLHVQVPQYLVDHWSGDRVEQHGQPKSIGGLGEALAIARDKEHIVTTSDLPIDVDDVLKAVRNNLVHLSSNSMEVELPRYSGMSTTGRFTIRDFVAKPNMVFDLVTDIPRFVNDQYVKLWKSGTRIK